MNAVNVPVLRPGDKIHLVVPANGMRVLLPRDQLAELERRLEVYREEYATVGVDIFAWSASNDIQWPVIAAIFRPDGVGE